MEILLVAVIDPRRSPRVSVRPSVHPPEPLERRHHIIEIPINPAVAPLAHLDGKGNAVEQADGFLVCPVLLVRIPSPDGGEIHGGNPNQLGLAWGQIKLPVLLFL